MGKFFSSWVSSAVSSRAGCVVALALFFLLIALIGLSLGYSLEEIDRWVDAQSVWISAVGAWVFRIVCGVIFFCCVLIIGFGIGDRVRTDRSAPREKFGCLAMSLAAIIGYFAWFGMVY